jgi:hypothetical protein
MSYPEPRCNLLITFASGTFRASKCDILRWLNRIPFLKHESGKIPAKYINKSIRK